MATLYGVRVGRKVDWLLSSGEVLVSMSGLLERAEEVGSGRSRAGGHQVAVGACWGLSVPLYEGGTPARDLSYLESASEVIR